MLKEWTGSLGDDYTDRQPHQDPGPELHRILEPAWPEITSLLEVGCNRGDNLAALRIPGEWRFPWGVEPNAKARKQARMRGLHVEGAEAGALPYGDGEYDLVFTVGVLIHIPPEQLSRALYEIHRVSRRFILAVEYEAVAPTPVDYRGVRAGIWKRDYGVEYVSRFPVNLVSYGQTQDVFDGCAFWLFDKRPLVSVR